MSLVDRIKEDLKSALKSGDAAKSGVLRLLLSELHNKEKEKFGAGGGNLSDADAIAVLKKESKKRTEAVGLFRKGGRDDLVKKEEAEDEIIKGYLPEAASAGEIEKIVLGVIGEGRSDFGSVMKEAMARLEGRASGKEVGEAAKKLLGR